MKSESEYHKPALLKEAIDYLKIKPGEVYVDATVGGGGHSEEILARGGKLIGLDYDSDAIEAAGKRLDSFCAKKACPLNAFRLVLANFADLGEVVTKAIHPAGILFDLGTSAHQLATPERGFSFKLNGPLDMRMNKNLQVTAADLVNGLGQKELNELFYKLGEEKYSRAITHAICARRQDMKITSTNTLAEIARQIYKKYKVHSKIDPATKIFQALRIAVNNELENLEKGLRGAYQVLSTGGRLVVISFHGLEDKQVKYFFRQPGWKIITPNPIRPGAEELAMNPRARSAKLRAAVKI